MGQVDRKALRRLLIQHFNKDEFRDLCFDLGIEYEDLEVNGKGSTARALIEYAERHNRINELIEECSALRPHVSWKDAISVPSAPPIQPTNQETIINFQVPFQLEIVDTWFELKSEVGTAVCITVRNWGDHDEEVSTSVHLQTGGVRITRNGSWSPITSIVKARNTKDIRVPLNEPGTPVIRRLVKRVEIRDALGRTGTISDQTVDRLNTQIIDQWSAPEVPKDIIPKRSGKPAIVLNEYEPDMLIVLHRLMRDITSGYDLITVDGWPEVLTQIALRNVQLVITDYNMPGMNGIKLTLAIKEAAPHISVVMVTAYATPELEKQSRIAGVDYYLPKPFPLDRLEQILRTELARTR